MVPSSECTASDKQAIRKHMMASRQALSSGEVEQRSRRVFDLFAAKRETLLMPAYQSVALYFPFRGEVDTRPFHHFFLGLGKRCLFPKIESPTSELKFYEVRDLAELRPGKLGIGEPQPRPGDAPALPDVVFVPGTAFSPDGHRLGYGAGHYDRTISAWGSARPRASFQLIGLAYSFQIVAALPSEPHDHPMDFIVVEDRVLKKGMS